MKFWLTLLSAVLAFVDLVVFFMERRNGQPKSSAVAA